MRPVIDLLRETVELYPLLTQACGDECDPVNDPNACLASQIAWALEHPEPEPAEPVHHHALQPGPVLDWMDGPGYPRPIRSATRILWWCPCGYSEEELR